MAAWYTASVACVAIPAALIVAADGWPSRCTTGDTLPAAWATYLPIEDAPGLPAPTVLGGADSELTGRLLAIGAPADPTGAGAPPPIDFLIWGDSHTLALTGTTHRLAAERGLRGVVATRAGTPPGLGLPIKPEGAAWNERIGVLLNTRDVPAVLLVARWSQYFRDDELRGNQSAEDALVGALRETVVALRRDGRRVFVVNQVPEQIRHVGRTVTRYASFGWDAPRGVTRARYDRDQRGAAAAIAAMVDAGAVEVDAAARLFPDANRASILRDDDGPFYFDDNHLSEHGGRTLLGPLLADVLDGLVGGSPGGRPPRRHVTGDAPDMPQ